MADLDDFFAKKDKKKKGTKKFSKANTDVIAKNLEETAIKEQKQQDKEITNIGDDAENVAQQVCSLWPFVDLNELKILILMIVSLHYYFSLTHSIL